MVWRYSSGCLFVIAPLTISSLSVWVREIFPGKWNTDALECCVCWLFHVICGSRASHRLHIVRGAFPSYLCLLSDRSLRPINNYRYLTVSVLYKLSQATFSEFRIYWKWNPVKVHLLRITLEEYGKTNRLIEKLKHVYKLSALNWQLQTKTEVAQKEHNTF